MSLTSDLTVETVEWKKSKGVLQLLRYVVFVVEQKVPLELELDGMDDTSAHFLASHLDDLPIGTGRLLPSGQIGRMAVLQGYRNKGVGSLILSHILEFARQNDYSQIFLHAQTHAMPFYERHGFTARGEEFMDAGIVHREMVIAD
ncbi:MAG: GNAT family N-acetyltransferase [Gammaproteobacteria bacterium]|nr:GNAT family N-acetyltransferase [Gammaproteobacteria bacterium]